MALKLDAACIEVPEMGYIFIAIGKNASTHLLSGIQKTYGGWNNKRWQFLKKEQIKHYPKHSTYAVVRNPYTRLSSCFNFMKTSEYPNKNPFVSMGTFEEFVRNVCDTPDDKSDKHFRSQHALLSSEGRFLPSRVWKIELEMDKAKEALGISEYVGYENTTKSENKFTPELQQIVYKRFINDFKAFNYGTTLPI